VPVRRVGRLVLDRVVDNFFAETEQVAFCTQNIVPGVDFTNDPLLQGRNFSYLDTQLKRLGSPNFTFIPVNAPKCPFATFQQDGHMAMANPSGRVNYEPNSWDGDAAGPREDPAGGFHSYDSHGDPGAVGEKRRWRSDTFADHYSQARQFYTSQTRVEQQHIADAFVFELSKCERPDIRMRMVANLMNVDLELAQTVADNLGITDTIERSAPAREPITDLPPSAALSIVRNGPNALTGRKVGILVSDGTDANLLSTLTEAITRAGAVFELVGPKVGGAILSDNALLPLHQKIEGGPSVLYDLVVLLPSEAGVTPLTMNAAARDFVSDAYAHCKFIGYAPTAQPLLDAAGVPADGDDAIIEMGRADGIDTLLERAVELRNWAREQLVHQT
jgi:catalase